MSGRRVDTAATFGTVIGLVAPDVVCFRADSGWTVTLRVPKALVPELLVGRRARLLPGPDGWPSSLSLSEVD